MRLSSEGNKSIFATLAMPYVHVHVHVHVQHKHAVPVSGSFESSSVGRITPGNAQLAATAERTCAARVTLSMRRHTWQTTYTTTSQTRNVKSKTTPDRRTDQHRRRDDVVEEHRVAERPRRHGDVDDPACPSTSHGRCKLYLKRCIAQ